MLSRRPKADGRAMSAWYAVIDTAQDERLYSLVRQCRTHSCLFSGELSPTLVAASPYLVAIEDGEPLLGIWRSHGSGRNWGIMCASSASIDAVRKSLRRFLQAKLPDGMIALFRFYDPRVFRTYLPAATSEERAPWFETIGRYSLEGEGEVIHDFHLRGAQLFDGETPVA